MDENPYLFVFNRSMDTLIGILVGLILNLDLYFKEMRSDDQNTSGEEAEV